MRENHVADSGVGHRCYLALSLWHLDPLPASFSSGNLSILPVLRGLPKQQNAIGNQTSLLTPARCLSQLRYTRMRC